ncbi:hypothetical protein C8R46DRAFT_1218821 [Mycena filopes]|nr:hypothetical protein C8R46DRAFT_1218821 [Mycena filopes]
MILTLAVFLVFAVRQSSALATRASPIHRSPRDSQTGATLQSWSNITLTNANGTLDASFPLRYATNITINGETFRVAIDTGSSDLWIRPNHDFTFNDTGIAVDEDYVAGVISGTIGVASVQLGGYSYEKL